MLQVAHSYAAHSILSTGALSSLLALYEVDSMLLPSETPKPHWGKSLPGWLSILTSVLLGLFSLLSDVG